MLFDEQFFDQGIQRRNTGCFKWSEEGCPDGALSFGVADMDFPCAPAIEQELEKRAKHASYGYSAQDKEGVQAFCAFWKRRHGLSIQPENTLTLPCVITGLKMAVRTLTKAGEEVAIFTPVYPPFYGSIRDNGRKVRACPLTQHSDGSYSMNLSAVEQAFADGVRLFLLCNPHNPVSRCWRAEELRALLTLAERYQAYIVSDEIHADFVYRPLNFTSVLSLDCAKERLMTFASASKTFNLAGLQQAQVISFNPELLKAFSTEMNAAGVTTGNIFAIYGTRAAYQYGDEWLDGLIQYLDGNRKYLLEKIGECLPKVTVAPIEATYLAFLDFSAYGTSSSELCDLLKKHGVIVGKGSDFGAEGEGKIRFNFGCPRTNIEEGIKRILKAVKEAWPA